MSNYIYICEASTKTNERQMHIYKVRVVYIYITTIFHNKDCYQMTILIEDAMKKDFPANNK